MIWNQFIEVSNMSHTVVINGSAIRELSLSDKEISSYLEHIRNLAWDNKFKDALIAVEKLRTCIVTWSDCQIKDCNETRGFEGQYGE